MDFTNFKSRGYIIYSESLIKLLLCILLIISASCNIKRKVTIITSPNDAVIDYNGTQYIGSAELNYPLVSSINVNKIGFIPEYLNIEDVPVDNIIHIVLDEVPKYKMKIEVNNTTDYSIYIDGKQTFQNDMELMEGSYKLEIRSKEFLTFNKSIRLNKDYSQTIHLTPKDKYVIENIPEDIIQISYGNQLLHEGDTVFHDRNRLILNYSTKDGHFTLHINLALFSYDKIQHLSIKDLLHIQPVELKSDIANDIFSIEGSWVKKLKEPAKVSPLVYYEMNTCQSGYFPGPFHGQNLILGPVEGLNMGAIINPTDIIKNSHMDIVIGNEKRTITFNSNIINESFSFDNFFDLEGYSWKNDEERLSQINSTLIPGIPIDQNPPYLGLKYSIKLFTENELYGSLDGVIEQKKESVGNIDISHVLKTSVFNVSTDNNKKNLRYIYTQDKYNEGYLVVHKLKGNINAYYYFVPLYVWKLSNIDDSPAVLSIREKADIEDLYFTVSNTLDIFHYSSAMKLP